mmetsp:Transcript_48030/g.79546  ORF Transcript_48030/g.79546 Transcript_48030/m.79546 type:complete len:187 (+) Transcript_48030:194-754(+)
MSVREEVQAYLTRHDIAQSLGMAVNAILRTQPPEPLRALGDYLKELGASTISQPPASAAAVTDMRITSAEAHFHPFQVGAPRPIEEHAAIDAFCDKFAAGLANPKDDALLNLFAENGSWADPVGGPPPYVGRDKLAQRITKLPPMDFAKVVEVYYTLSPKIFLCKTEVKFSDKPASFFILDKFVVT